MLEKLSKEDVDWIKDEVEAAARKATQEVISSTIWTAVIWVFVVYIFAKIIGWITGWPL